MAIPKIIHLCWFGRGKYPKLAEMCIDSWKKYLPNYDIIIWNEDNFDVNSNYFTREAYKNKKWAFITDYVRLKALYEYGGIYMDTDLEVIRDFSELLVGKKFVTSFIEGGLITAGFIAAEKGHPYIKSIMSYYDNQSKVKRNLEMVMNPIIFSVLAYEKYGIEVGQTDFENAEVQILKMDYFMPYKKISFGKSNYSHKKYIIKKNTYTIHHDMSSWATRSSFKSNILGIIRFVMPQKIYNGMKIKKNRKIVKSYLNKKEN